MAGLSSSGVGAAASANASPAGDVRADRLVCRQEMMPPTGSRPYARTLASGQPRVKPSPGSGATGGVGRLCIRPLDGVHRAGAFWVS